MGWHGEKRSGTESGELVVRVVERFGHDAVLRGDGSRVRGTDIAVRGPGHVDPNGSWPIALVLGTAWHGSISGRRGHDGFGSPSPFDPGNRGRTEVIMRFMNL